MTNGQGLVVHHVQNTYARASGDGAQGVAGAAERLGTRAQKCQAKGIARDGTAQREVACPTQEAGAGQVDSARQTAGASAGGQSTAVEGDGLCADNDATQIKRGTTGHSGARARSAQTRCMADGQGASRYGGVSTVGVVARKHQAAAAGLGQTETSARDHARQGQLCTRHTDQAVGGHGHTARQTAGARGGGQGAALERDGFSIHCDTLQVQSSTVGDGGSGCRAPQTCCVANGQCACGYSGQTRVGVDARQSACACAQFGHCTGATDGA